MEFYFQDHLRLDWGLGNPNKTAALIACLLVGIHVIRFIIRKPWGDWAFAIAFLGLGICLIETYSRGGIVAAIVGQLGYWCARTRGKFSFPPKRQILMALILTALLAGYASLPRVNATSRYALGVLPGREEDRSITNRLRIWKDTPRMMVDAPTGWGWGKSGQAWTQWYQPVSTRYEYRTLVNSHLTWLVELGWVGRFFYLAGWGLVFSVCFLGRSERPIHRRGAGIACGIWIAFAVSAFFSSVAETALLWIVPILATVPMIVLFFKNVPRLADFLWPALVAVGVVILFVMVGMLSPQKSKISHGKKGTLVGNRPARALVLRPDKRVVGMHYGHLIREYAEHGWRVSERVPLSVDSSVKQIVLSGEYPDLTEIPKFEGDLVLLNPLIELKKNSRQGKLDRVILGQQRKDPAARSIRFLSTQGDIGWVVESSPGKKVFLGDWIKPILPK